MDSTFTCISDYLYNLDMILRTRSVGRGRELIQVPKVFG